MGLTGAQRIRSQAAEKWWLSPTPRRRGILVMPRTYERQHGRAHRARAIFAVGLFGYFRGPEHVGSANSGSLVKA